MNRSTPPALTGALEDYLETIYRLVAVHSFARVRDIAKERNVKAGSVSPALKRLSDMGLVRYERREYVTLTPTGEQAARKVYARHRLLTRFFENVLQMDHETAEAEACAMEHSLSDEGMDRFTRFFEFLGTCPHGASEFLQRFHGCSRVHSNIPECTHHCEWEPDGNPARDGQAVRLVDLTVGQSGRVSQIRAEGGLRHRLLDMGILPQVRFEIERIDLASGLVWVSLHGTQLELSQEEASAVLVETH